nr:DNA repair protein RAD16-like [Ipomoea batatas]
MAPAVTPQAAAAAWKLVDCRWRAGRMNLKSPVVIFFFVIQQTCRLKQSSPTSLSTGVSHHLALVELKQRREKSNSDGKDKTKDDQLHLTLVTSPPSLLWVFIRLEVKQSAEGTQEVPGLIEARVYGTDEVWELRQSSSPEVELDLLDQLMLMNSVVTHTVFYSHSLLRVTVVGENLINGQRTRSHLWLVDLAGSESLRGWGGLKLKVTLRRDSLDVKEEDYYTSLYNASQAQFNTYVREGTVSNNYAHIFDLHTRLPATVELNLVMTRGYMINQNDFCHYHVPSCAHTFCRTCLEEFSSGMAKVSCPTCSKSLTTGLLNGSGNRDSKNRTTIKGFRASSILNRIVLDEFQTSTKIDALREENRFMVERDGSAKGIVFSQFTEFLDLIHYSLIKAQGETNNKGSISSRSFILESLS